MQGADIVDHGYRYHNSIFSCFYVFSASDGKTNIIFLCLRDNINFS